MAMINRFPDLDAYRLALGKSRKIFDLTRGFPKEELDQAVQCSYIHAEQLAVLDGAWARVGAMLNRMISRVSEFCGSERP